MESLKRSYFIPFYYRIGHYLVKYYVTLHIGKSNTCVVVFSNIRESKAMAVNTQVFPVPDLAWTIRSEQMKMSINNIISI